MSLPADAPFEAIVAHTLGNKLACVMGSRDLARLRTDASLQKSLALRGAYPGGAATAPKRVLCDLIVDYADAFSEITTLLDGMAEALDAMHRLQKDAGRRAAAQEAAKRFAVTKRDGPHDRDNPPPGAEVSRG